MSQTRMLVVDTGEGVVQVQCCSLSFDGGSLICFSDAGMHTVVAGFSPGGWRHCFWEDAEEAS